MYVRRSCDLSETSNESVTNPNLGAINQIFLEGMTFLTKISHFVQHKLFWPNEMFPQYKSFGTECKCNF